MDNSLIEEAAVSFLWHSREEKEVGGGGFIFKLKGHSILKIKIKIPHGIKGDERSRRRPS